MKKIYCLFSIANDYNQPKNNLVAWWSEKPTPEQLVDLSFAIVDSELVLKGHEVRDAFGTYFQLREVSEGVMLPE